MDRIEEIKKRMDKSKNIFLFDKNEFESFKKITNSFEINDYEVLTDTGFVDIKRLHQTIPYVVYHLRLANGKELKCADNHIVFINEYDEITFEPIGLSEIFVKDLNVGSFILVLDDDGNLKESEIIEIRNLNYEEVMYDLELSENSNHRYYTNGILSHNTHLAKQLAKEIFGDSDALIRVDMSEYQEKFAMSRLIGSPPGYVGYNEGGQLTEQVRNKPYSVILFDEIEKAHKDIFTLLLQTMDEGFLTDSLGRKINFKNTLIIMTSNIGARKLQDFGSGVGFGTNARINKELETKKLIVEDELKKFFPPEFINRVDDIVYFNSLKEEQIVQIVNIELNKLISRLQGINYLINIGDNLVKRIADIGFDEKFGARPIKRAIQSQIEDFISDEILKGNIVVGVQYTLDVVDNKIAIVNNPKPKKTKTKKSEA